MDFFVDLAHIEMVEDATLDKDWKRPVERRVSGRESDVIECEAVVTHVTFRDKIAQSQLCWRTVGARGFVLLLVSRC